MNPIKNSYGTTLLKQNINNDIVYSQSPSNCSQCSNCITPACVSNCLASIKEQDNSDFN